MKDDEPSSSSENRQASQAIAFARLNATRLGSQRRTGRSNASATGFYLYLFNFDGVIANTLQHYQNAVHLAARTAGVKIMDVPLSVLTNAETLDAHGIADSLGLAQDVRPRFANLLESNLNNGLWRCACFDGTRQLLNTLSSRGYTAILSRSKTSMVETILQNNGLRNSVHRVIGSDQSGTQEEQLEQLLRQYGVKAENSIYCGDSVRDINFAHRQGMRSAACTWGWQPQLVSNCDATFTAHRTGQLLAQLLAPAGLEPDVAV
ncbi:MAG: HAD family hydrolase [Granulosicoccaceae bacterium]